MFMISYIVPITCLNYLPNTMKFNNHTQKLVGKFKLKILYRFQLKKDNRLNDINYFIDSLIL
jgi:hypothetical protein